MLSPPGLVLYQPPQVTNKHVPNILSLVSPPGQSSCWLCYLMLESIFLLCISWCWDGWDMSPSLGALQATQEVDTVAPCECPRQWGCSWSLEWVVPSWYPEVCHLPPPHRRERHLCSFPLSLETVGRDLPFLGWELPAYGVVWKGNSSCVCKRPQVAGSWETVRFLLGVGSAS